MTRHSTRSNSHSDSGEGSTATARGRLIVMVGLPGSGKTTYVQRHLKNAIRVSLDDVRMMFSGHAFEPRNEMLVAKVAWSALEAAVEWATAQSRDVVLDATNVTRDYRVRATALAHRHGVRAICVFIDVPVDVATRRNAERDRRVPSEVVARFASRLVRPEENEGFDEVLSIGVDGESIR